MNRDRNASFWTDRWKNNEIGFHRETPHPSLDTHWTELGIAESTGVFVPLCGKSRDMTWLAERGHRVVGVELARQACVDFFKQIDRTPEITELPNFEVFKAAPYTIYCGDVFDMKARFLGETAAVYDRASLVALPPNLQNRFAGLMATLATPETRILMVALDYDESEMTGPPYSTSPESIHATFSPHFSVEILSRQLALHDNAGLAKRGLTALIETCYLLRRLP